VLTGPDSVGPALDQSISSGVGAYSSPVRTSDVSACIKSSTYSANGRLSIAAAFFF
jgi:hypothetical protein